MIASIRRDLRDNIRNHESFGHISTYSIGDPRVEPVATSMKAIHGLVGLAIGLMAGGLEASEIAYESYPDVALPRLESVVSTGLEARFLVDGGLLLSGGFAWVNDQARANFVRLKGDGSIDESYHPELAPNTWYRSAAVAVQSDGTVYLLRGEQVSAATVIRRLDPDGSTDDTYALAAGWTEPPAGNQAAYLTSITAGAADRLLVAGSFDTLGAVAANRVALLRADGTIDPDFHWTLPLTAQSVVPLADGRWIVAGPVDLNQALPGEEASNLVPDLPRVAIVRVRTDGSPDPDFTPYVVGGSWLYGPQALVLDDQGRLVFAESNASSTEFALQLTRLLSDGSPDASFAPILPEIRQDQVTYLGPGIADISPGGSHADDGTNSFVWLPPQVGRIVPAGNGAVMCFANWLDDSLHGVVGIAADGTIDAAIVPYSGARFGRWLQRDHAGNWWGDFASLELAPPVVGLRRLAADGSLDPDIVVNVTEAGRPFTVTALPDGAVAVQGRFDLAGGIRQPGLVIVEGDGTVRNNRAPDALPWRSTTIVAALRDGSLLVEPTPSPANVQTTADSVNPGFLDGPRLGRLFADGSWQVLVPADSGYFSAITGWLDADDRVVVLAPGQTYSPSAAFDRDLIRFLADGSLDDSFHPEGESGVVPDIHAAALADDRRGAWAVSWNASHQHLLRLDESGHAVKTIALMPREIAPYTRSTNAVASATGGAVIGGGFDRINLVESPGLARMREDGSIEPDWGGWLLPDSSVTVLRRLDNGLLFATGYLRTPVGEKSALLFTADGLPLPSQPDLPYPGTNTSQGLLSTDGIWMAQLPVDDDGMPTVVLRWKAVDTPTIHVVPSIDAIAIGESITLDADWFGVPSLGVTWYRNGQVVDLPSGARYTFTVTKSDVGVVYWAFVGLEGGGGYFTQPWVLALQAPKVRLVNASIRAVAGTGDNRLIVGAVLDGIGTGRILARALGPALDDLGVGGHAGNLTSRLVLPGGTEVAPPEDYRQSRDLLRMTHPDIVAAALAKGAHDPAFNPASGNDQMIYEDIATGTYHFHVTPWLDNGTGVVLGELFMLNAGGGGRGDLTVRNFSGRAPLLAGDGVLIGGFVIQGDHSMRLLLRGIGPGLLGYGIETAAMNPRLDLYAGPDFVSGNDDWSATTENRDAVEAANAAAGAFALGEGSADAAMVVELNPGLYTVIVRSDNPDNVGRIVLLEVYALE